MTKKILIIDDVRADGDIGIDFPHFAKGASEPNESVLIARTYSMGIAALELMGPWDVLYLDHDYGDATGKTGYDIICWIEQMAHSFKFNLIPKEMVCISSNGAGIENINRGWKAIQERLPELIKEYENQKPVY